MATTQVSAYTFTSGRDRPPLPRKVEFLLEQIRTSVETINEHTFPNRSIWRGSRHTNIRRPIQAFQSKAINNALRRGDFWTNIPTYEQRARCSSCNHSPESLEHILLDCSHPTTERIWSLAKDLWPGTTTPWPTLSLGVLLGCGSLALPPSDDQPYPQGPSRLLRILLSESAHLIWVLRCERVIHGTEHAIAAIETRSRNKIDQRIATFHKGKHFTRELIQQTWTPQLI